MNRGLQKSIQTGLLFALFPLFLHAGEVSENTQTSAFSVLLANMNDVKTNIEGNGTTRVTGYLAEKLDSQVLSAIEASREESAAEEKKARSLQTASRGLAVVSADSILSAGNSQVEFPSVTASKSTSSDGSWGISLGSSGSMGTASNGSRFGSMPTTKAFSMPVLAKSQYSVGAVPNVNRLPDTSGVNIQKMLAGTGTKFGKNPADEDSAADLLKEKKDPIKEALAKQQQLLALLKDMKRDREEQDKQAAEIKEEVSKIKERKSPYEWKDYMAARELFERDAAMKKPVLKGDKDFPAKAADIFNYIPEGSIKSFGEMDSDAKRDPYANFVREYSEGKNPKGTPVPVPSPTPTHKGPEHKPTH